MWIKYIITTLFLLLSFVDAQNERVIYDNKDLDTQTLVLDNENLSLFSRWAELIGGN